jgi:cytochrome c-type biogenesis protein CcmH/NrfF
LKNQVAASSSFMSWFLPVSILGIGAFLAFRYYRKK